MAEQSAPPVDLNGKNMKTIIYLLSAMLFFTTTTYADEEASNSLYISANGPWYAKSIPHESYGTKGRTDVYLATEKADSLQYTYDWYSPGKLRLKQWAWGVSVVRFGPWQRGSKASEDDLALAFYNGNELLASYNTLDLAGKPESVSTSTSHYTVIKKIHGYRWLGSNDYVFEIETEDGRTISFDIATGKVKPKSERVKVE